jgi:hypothetical protein
MDGKSGGVSGLFSRRTGEARDDQLLATSPPVLSPKALDEKLHLRASVRERHVVEYEVPPTPQLDQVTRVDKLPNLCIGPQKGEVVVLGTHIRPVYGCLRAPERLPLNLGAERQ